MAAFTYCMYIRVWTLFTATVLLQAEAESASSQEPGKHTSGQSNTVKNQIHLEVRRFSL